jgi:hypothetical protein
LGVAAWKPVGFAAMAFCWPAMACGGGEAKEPPVEVGVVKPTKPLMLAPCEADTGLGATN